MHDRYRKRFRVAAAPERLRRQIALEAARRLYPTLAPPGEEPADGWLDLVSANDLYLAKRKAAAVLGQRLRPGDLPSDSEVREQLVAIRADAAGGCELPEPLDETDTDDMAPALAEHLDRFALYKMRLLPLEAVKQNPKYHPEGDALYHSLQVFELAREARPYDEEFLLAALLHDVGKAIDPHDHVAAALESLRGAITERTTWLIEHHMDLMNVREKPMRSKLKRELESSEYYDDLKQLRELDEAGRVPGQPAISVDEALAYLKSLEDESYLESRN